RIRNRWRQETCRWHQPSAHSRPRPIRGALRGALPQRLNRAVVVDLLNSLAGFLVGMLVGFTGVGGGALMTPLLVFMFGIAPQTAIGTDLLFAAITKGFGG